MKPVPIAQYLGQSERGAGERPALRPVASPFRPRSLQTAPTGETRAALPSFARPLAEAAAAPARATDERPERSIFERRALPRAVPPSETRGVDEAEVERRVAESYAHGQREGRAMGRAEAGEERARELATAQERALIERLEFQLNEYARLETAIREGLVEAEERIGAAVARILGPFLHKQVVAHVVDELVKAIQRLGAGGAPGLVTIRGPESVLALLGERIAGLPVEVDYVQSAAIDVSVEAQSTLITTELKPWADLLAGVEG